MKKLLQEIQIAQDGFSSDQQLKQEQIHVRINKRLNESQNKHKQQAKFVIPPASQIKDNQKIYSLHPDIATGWVPKVLLPNPIPIIYQNLVVDKIVKELLKPQKENIYKVKYLGARYQNSYFMHEGKSYTFPYNHIKKPETKKLTDREFLGNNQKVQGLKFDSLFESGNLDCAIKVNQFEYDLFIQVDSNTKGHMQWYYFKITEAAKGVKYKFNICNFQKNKSLYTRGMKPYVYSQKKFQNCKIEWEQTGSNLRYERKSLRYKFLSDYYLGKFYRLSFQYEFQYEDDVVQFAYCIPYQYSYLLSFIDELVSRNKKNNNNFINVEKLTTSLGGLDLPLLTIHQEQSDEKKFKTSKQIKFNLNQQEEDISSKKCIIISGRAHPGESNGSFMMHGFLDFLCSSNPYAQFLRKKIIFKIVPMLNPDGVVIGNYRTGLSGKDFNRQFLKPDKTIFPEIHAFKDLVIKSKRMFNNNLLLFLDFHGHSIKKNVFMYGPEFVITEKYYYQTKVFPKLLGQYSEMFRYYSCIFKVSTFKQTTARAILLKKLDIPYSYTIQASNGSYYDKKQMKDVAFNSKLWIQMGNNIASALYEYCSGLIMSQELKFQKKKQKKIITMTPIKKRQPIIERPKIYASNQSTSPKNNSKTIYIHGNNNSYNQYKPIKEFKLKAVMNIEKFTNIIEQIKKQQQQQRQKISDDELSEGSSDKQQQTDDLSTDKIRKLHKIIKCKKIQNLDECKLDIFKEREFENRSQNNEIIHSAPQNQQNQFPPIVFNHTFVNRFRETFRNHTPRKEIQEKSPSNQQARKFKPSIKVSNISFYSPYANEMRKIIRTPNDKFSKNIEDRKSKFFQEKNHLSHIVQNLNKTYIIIKDKEPLNEYMPTNLTFYQLQKKARQQQLKYKKSIEKNLETIAQKLRQEI